MDFVSSLNQTSVCNSSFSNVGHTLIFAKISNRKIGCFSSKCPGGSEGKLTFTDSKCSYLKMTKISNILVFMNSCISQSP